MKQKIFIFIEVTTSYFKSYFEGKIIKPLMQFFLKIFVVKYAFSLKDRVGLIKIN